MGVILRCKSRLQVMLAQKKERKKKRTVLKGTLGHRISFFLPNLNRPLSLLVQWQFFEKSVDWQLVLRKGKHVWGGGRRRLG